ncbi:hypothetical protein CK203_065763 [Vitis vinifera]|uniref:Uncharacterized protein n=1 Tax=Vitis vinifera TaxID=29760 RepID=A0A438G2N8_VITVI|nr:hypothetical protein CK203_065763 [Vitis vinifera]
MVKVINFVDYSLKQGAPAGHESAETPIGHESNDIQQHLGLLPPPQPDLPTSSKSLAPIEDTIPAEDTTIVEVQILPPQEATTDAITSIDPRDEPQTVATVIRSQLVYQLIHVLSMVPAMEPHLISCPASVCPVDWCSINWCTLISVLRWE